MVDTAYQGPHWVSHGVADQKIPIHVLDTDSDPVTGVSSPTTEASKNGASYAALNDGTWAEISKGDYTVQLDETDTNKLGWMIVSVTKAGITEAKALVYVGIDQAEFRSGHIRLRTLHRTGK
tara:strand:+ start:121 stop:486 length:366 start_codon:yes stop_codon:yes gene_type:complete